MAEDTGVSSFGEKLDAIGTHLTGLHSKLDAIQGSHAEHGKRLDALAKRMDAIENGDADDEPEAEERERADARERDDAKRRADGESDEERATRHTAEDAAWKASASKRRDARRMAADAVARVMRPDAAMRQIDADKHKFAEFWLKADAAFQAQTLGQAPQFAHGESLNDYRCRLLSKLKHLSKLYGKTDLETLIRADQQAFTMAEDEIITSAIEASRNPANLVGQLRKEVKRLPTGHTETKYYGDSAVTWAPFSGGGVQFVRFNQDLARASQIATAGRR